MFVTVSARMRRIRNNLDPILVCVCVCIFVGQRCSLSLYIQTTRGVLLGLVSATGT